MTARRLLATPPRTSGSSMGRWCDLWIGTDRHVMDDAAILALLHWTTWPPAVNRRLLDDILRGGWCFGLFDRQQQIGFAHVAAGPSGASVWISQVVIAAAYRGRGIGQWFMTSALCHPRVAMMTRISLASATQQRFYARLGFLPDPADTQQVTLVLERPPSASEEYEQP